MNVVDALRCKVGRHSGTWSHPGSRCQMVRTCESCGRTEEITRHRWGPFGGYLAPDDCAQIRRCERCGATESRSLHEWGPWLYANTEFTAPQVRTCRRCHRSERTLYTVR